MISSFVSVLDELSALLVLSRGELTLCVVAIFVAALVRGFTGFALSALVMASLALVMPPVSLIPVCFVLEATASLLMFRGGARAANWSVVRGLVIGSALGMPLGLYATVHLPPDTSRLVALLIIMTLAALQLVGGSPAGRPAALLGTRTGLYASGLLAGIVTGLASVGGMIVALYVLALNAPPVRMRASLVTFLFLGMFTSGAWLVFSGVLDRLAFARGVAFAPLVVAGVLLGSALFRPALQGFYKRFCLTLLIGLALAGLVRLAWSH